MDRIDHENFRVDAIHGCNDAKISASMRSMDLINARKSRVNALKTALMRTMDLINAIIFRIDAFHGPDECENFRVNAIHGSDERHRPPHECDERVGKDPVSDTP